MPCITGGASRSIAMRVHKPATLSFGGGSGSGGEALFDRDVRSRLHGRAEGSLFGRKIAEVRDMVRALGNDSHPG